jgi:sterol desaturase/sphingolipid hydroxylase (fatty acid hydroxylase superfamily)
VKLTVTSPASLRVSFGPICRTISVAIDPDSPGDGVTFDHPWLDRLTVGHPAWPLVVYGPGGILLAALAIQGLGLGTTVASYLGGLILWTLVEYAVHRVSFHHTPATPGQVAYGYLIHGVHHAYPDDSRRWVMPVVVTVPISTAIGVAFWLTFGRVWPAVLGGLLHGYLAYDLIHYAVHSGRSATRIGRYLRQYHLAHHYATPDRRFGVSSPLWDLVFRTR